MIKKYNNSNIANHLMTLCIFYVMMSCMSAIRKILVKLYCLKFTRHVKRSNFTIISNDCVGGVLYKRMNKFFLSPFINLYLEIDDYFFLLSHFYEIINLPVEENKNKNSNIKFPVGKITYKNKSINIYFMHYPSFQIALQKWNERKQRIKYNDMYIILNLTNNLNIKYVENILNKFEQLPFKNKIALSRFNIHSKSNKQIIFKNKKFEIAQIFHPHGFSKPIDQLILGDFFKN